jgi:hypothetical protein
MDAYYAYSQYVGSIVDDNKTELNFKSVLLSSTIEPTYCG